MSAKPSFSSLHTQLKDTKTTELKIVPTPIPEQKKTAKQKVKEKAPADKKSPKVVGDNIPRGERSNFLKITITMPSELLSSLRSLGMDRKARGERDTDVSSLLREAAALLLKH